MPALFFGGFERISGVDYEVTLALLSLLRCLAFSWLVYRIFLIMSGDRSVATLGAVLGTLANFELPRTLGWSLC